LLKEWQRNATTDLEIIDRWWSAHRGANIGIATSNAVVVDSDPRHGGDESLAELEGRYGGLPDTWRAQTAHGGDHFWFDPGSVVVRNSASKLGPGLDVRGRGGYVVAPPSKLEEGSDYLWVAGYGPHELPLAPMPAWLLALLQGAGSSSKRRNGADGQRVAAGEWGDLLTGGIPEGRIQTTLWRVAAHLGGKNVAPPVLYACAYALGVVTGLEKRRVVDIVKRALRKGKA
jgi:hypothetical protein